MRLPYMNASPVVDQTAFVAPNTTLIGDITIGPEASVWFGSVLRADVMPIRIGARTSVQDLSMLHATRQWMATEVGEDCTIGHGVLLHGCKVENLVLVGMGTIVLDGAVIGAETIIGAGSLITTNVHIPSGVLALGRPAKVMRELTDRERQFLRSSAHNYVVHAHEYRELVNQHALATQ